MVVNSLFDDAYIADRVRAEQVRLLFHGLPYALLAAMLIATLLAAILWAILPKYLVLGWWVIMLGISIGRILIYRAFKASGDGAHRQLKYWENAFLIGVSLHALAWGSLAVFLFPEDIVYQVIVAFVLGGMAAGAVPTLSFQKLPIRIFVILSLAPLIVQLLASDSTDLKIMALMAIMFVVVVISSAGRLYKNYRQNIQLRLQSNIREAGLQRNIYALQELHNIASNPGAKFSEKVAELLRLGNKTFGMDIGIVSNIVEQVYTIKYIEAPQGAPGPGDTFDFSETYCANTFLGDEPRGFHCVKKSEIATHPCYKKFKLEAYIGVPIIVDGERYGTLNFSSATPRELPFADFELALMQIFSQWLGTELSRTSAMESLRQFKTTLDMTKDCVFIFSPDDLRFTYFNQGAVDQVGYSYDELLGMSSVDIKPEISETQFREMIRPMLKGEYPTLNFETIHQHKNGKKIPVEIHLQYINPPDEHPRFVAIVRDITERKRIEKMKDEFVSTVSHELRTPLTSIRGALGLINGGVLGELPVETSHMLSIASNNTERLLLLINDILDVQKIESGNLEFQFSPIDLHVLLHEVLADSAGLARVHNVEFRYVGDCTGVQILGDRDRLTQVLTNLLSNAAKFSPDDAEVEIACELAGERARVSVTDHGPGIPASYKGDLFAKFTQVDSSDARRIGGTGLGLSIAKLIVDKHGGTINYSSLEGDHTTFYFDLPIVTD